MRKKRRAYTLIEMLVVITVGAVLTGIAISLLLVLLRAEQSGRTHAELCNSLDRLADQFRRDVHATGDVVVKGDERQEWQIELPDKCSVQYTVGADGISREERTESKDARRELYMLSKDSTATIAIDRTTNPPVASLTIQPKEASEQPGRAVRIDAALGQDLRFVKQPKEDK